jgi:hypothetical protein
MTLEEAKLTTRIRVIGQPQRTGSIFTEPRENGGACSTPPPL